MRRKAWDDQPPENRLAPARGIFLGLVITFVGWGVLYVLIAILLMVKP